MSTAWQAPLDYVPQNERAEAWTVMIDAVFTLSCPVCCAPADPVARESVNMGIVVVLGVTTVVLAA